MSDTPSNLVRFWSSVNFASPPYWHPEDRPLLAGTGDDQKAPLFDTFEDYSSGKSFGAPHDDRLHLSLLPQPFVGNIDEAPIVVLLLNPGLSTTDYYGELAEPVRKDFRKRLFANLSQNFHGCEFPFMWLDPQICWHGGYRWWEKKLSKTLSEIAESWFDGDYRSARRELSRRIAQVELFPYHSKSFGSRRLLASLPSVQRARAFVRDYLFPAALAGKKTVIVTRSAAAWGVEECAQQNIVIYRGVHALSAGLGPTTAGGDAIIRYFRENWARSRRPTGLASGDHS